MAGAVAGIALPEGEPGAIFDAAAALVGAAAAFGDASHTVGGAVSQVGTWQGEAAGSFRTLAAGYEQAGVTAAEVLREAAASVRRYGVQFEDAYDSVKRLQGEAELCVEQIELWERRRADAAEREAAAQTRAANAVLGAGLDATGGSLAAQADAYLEADAAAADRLHAEQKLEALREELEDLRSRAKAERERAEEAESRAATQVTHSAGSLPSVHSPGGMGASPALGAGAAMGVPAVYRGGATNQFGVYRGGATTRNADFLGDLLGFSREVDREMGPVDEAINEGVDKAEGVGKEVLGINDAERSKEATSSAVSSTGRSPPRSGNGARAQRKPARKSSRRPASSSPSRPSRGSATRGPGRSRSAPASAASRSSTGSTLARTIPSPAFRFAIAGSPTSPSTPTMRPRRWGSQRPMRSRASRGGAIWMRSSLMRRRASSERLRVTRGTTWRTVGTCSSFRRKSTSRPPTAAACS